MSSLILEGQKVIPARLTEAGFEFRFPDLDIALSNLLKTQ
jgi:Predicted nucleoside-diphosphate sugar epimerase